MFRNPCVLLPAGGPRGLPGGDRPLPERSDGAPGGGLGEDLRADRERATADPGQEPLHVQPPRPVEGTNGCFFASECSLVVCLQ